MKSTVDKVNYLNTLKIACRVYVHKKGKMQRSKFEEMKA